MQPAPLIITASRGSMTYGGPAFVAMPLYAGFAKGDTGQPDGKARLREPGDQHQSGRELLQQLRGRCGSELHISYVAGNVMVTQATTSVALTTSVNPSDLHAACHLHGYTCAAVQRNAGRDGDVL